MTKEGEDGPSTVPILPAETATNQASILSHAEGNTAAHSIYSGDGGVWQVTEQIQLMGAANGLSDAVVGGAARRIQDRANRINSVKLLVDQTTRFGRVALLREAEE